MKNFAKELLFILALAGMLAGVGIAWDAMCLSIREWWAGEYDMKTALYMTMVFFAMGVASVELYAAGHRFVAKTRGMKAIEGVLEQFKTENAKLIALLAKSKEVDDQHQANFNKAERLIKETVEYNRELADIAESRLVEIQRLQARVKQLEFENPKPDNTLQR